MFSKYTPTLNFLAAGIVENFDTNQPNFFVRFYPHTVLIVGLPEAAVPIVPVLTFGHFKIIARLEFRIFGISIIGWVGLRFSKKIMITLVLKAASNVKETSKSYSL